MICRRTPVIITVSKTAVFQDSGGKHMNRYLYCNGNILTMDEEKERVSAVLTDGERIAAVGDYEELLASSDGAEVIDLGGKTLMPAFIDGHSHLAETGIDASRCDLTGSCSFDEILERILKFREKNHLTHGEVILCRGYDQNQLKEQAHPVAAVLDAAGIDNPVLCKHQSGHMLTANTKAMRVRGLSDDAVCLAGGMIGRDEKGFLTGYFEENAMALISPYFFSPTDQEVEQAIINAQRIYLSHGITTIQDGSANTEQRIRIYEKLAAEGKLLADVVIYMSANQGEELWNRVLARLGNRQYHDHLKIGGVKIFLDGSPQVRTAWMKRPYEGENTYCGYPRCTDEYVEETVIKASRLGLQVLAHCNGDAAAAQFVTAVEKAAKLDPKVKLLRHEVVHLQTTADEEIERMARLGMTATVFSGHVWYWGDVHMKNFGPIRGSRISPIKKCIELQIPANFHQDSPVTQPDMLHTIWCAVNRVTKSGKRIGPEYRISVREALAAATRIAAYPYFEEGKKGILRPGARADMIILDQDPLTADPCEIRDIKVTAVIKDGTVVY